KNAALPQLAAALLTPHPVTLRGIPALADVGNMRRLLTELGCDGTDIEDGIRLESRDETASHARYDIVRTMRASISVLGPMLARRGYARVSMPGGCAIGDRPVDLHLRGLAALGAEFSLDSGDIIGRAPSGGRLRGARVFLGGPFGPTVLGTANVLSAAVLAEGQTVIESAACEPEVTDLARLLIKMGAQIEGAGTPRIIIEGVRELQGTEHEVIPDRIEAGTYMVAAAVTGGRLTITNCPRDALMAVEDHLRRAGVRIEPDMSPGADAMRSTCEVWAPERPTPVHITTQPHPGFPTDVQAQTMTLLALANGNSTITERIFPDRFLHVAELSRMGAQLYRQGPTVVVSGVPELIGAPVMASDLRASAGLVLAGLAAKGRTVVRRVYHLDRGYHRMERTLEAVGAQIQRVDERELPLME
ncbi:MAG: UDP-N-acetylglucosamine 1-carboxyvinyltransferase, partial [Planctomycetota bacterium]